LIELQFNSIIYAIRSILNTRETFEFS